MNKKFFKSGYKSEDFELSLIYPDYDKDIDKLKKTQSRTKVVMWISIIIAVISIAYPASNLGDIVWLGVVLSFVFFALLICSAYINAKVSYKIEQYVKLEEFINYLKNKKKIKIEELPKTLSKKEGFNKELLARLIEIGKLDYFIEDDFIVKKEKPVFNEGQKGQGKK